MGVRAEHLMGMLRRVDANEGITRIWVLDHMVDLVTEYIGISEADKVQNLYMNWALGKDGNYDEFRKLFEDLISGVEDLPEAVKWRFNAYMEYLFPGPLPT